MCLSRDWGPLDTSHIRYILLTRTLTPRELQNLSFQLAWLWDCVGTREGNVVLAVTACPVPVAPLPDQPPYTAWPQPLGFQLTAQHPLASLNTRRCCVGDLSSY